MNDAVLNRVQGAAETHSQSQGCNWGIRRDFPQDGQGAAGSWAGEGAQVQAIHAQNRSHRPLWPYGALSVVHSTSQRVGEVVMARFSVPLVFGWPAGVCASAWQCRLGGVNQRGLFSQGSGGRTSTVTVPADLFLLRALSLACRWPPSGCVLTWPLLRARGETLIPWEQGPGRRTSLNLNDV